MNNNKKPTRDPQYLLEQIGNEYQIRHRDRDTAIFINGTAALLWELCDGNQTVGEIKHTLQQAWPDAADVIDPDVDEALAMLREHQVLAIDQKG